MNNFSTFIIGFCSSCILLGFLYTLCPQDKLKNSVKYVFCLCFLCCILSGIGGISKLDLGEFKGSYSIPLLTEQSAAITAQMVFSQALIDKNINFTKIAVDTNKLSDNSITISRVTVFTAEKVETIKSIIGSDSYEVCVINE